MPRTQPKSVDIAIKHFFRNLGNFDRLRKNSIAAQVFRSWNIDDTSRGRTAALAQIRDAVLQHSAQLRDEEAASGTAARAFREHEIVRLHYINGKSLQDVANVLGISVKHCYRHRLHVCGKIASRLLASSHPPLSVKACDEEFYFLINRLRECSSSSRLELRALRYLENGARLPHHKLAVIFASTELLIKRGEFTEAGVEHERARALYEQHYLVIPHDMRSVATAGHDLAASMLAQAIGKRELAFVHASSAAIAMSQVSRGELPYVQYLGAAAKFELASVLWNRGRLAEAYDCLHDIAARFDTGYMQTSLALQVKSSLWKLRTYLSGSKTGRYSLAARLDGLKAAYKQAMRMNMPIEALDCLLAIVECHAFARRDEQARDVVRTSIRLARETGILNVSEQTALDVAVRLLLTSFWREGSALIAEAENWSGMDRYHLELRDYAMALGALRAGDAAALRRYRCQSLVNGRSTKTLVPRWHIIDACCASLSGSANAAREAASAAVESAGRAGATPTMRDAFAIAKSILGGKKFAQGEDELSRILAA